MIRKLPNGVFAADLTLQNEETIRTVDARSSDAVALAIRVGAPIYTTSEVLDEASYLPEEKQTEERTRPSSTPSRRRPGNTPPPAPEKLSDMPDSMLAQLMQKAVEEENYEEAAKIKSEIERRKE